MTKLSYENKTSITQVTIYVYAIPICSHLRNTCQADHHVFKIGFLKYCFLLHRQTPEECMEK